MKPSPSWLALRAVLPRGSRLGAGERAAASLMIDAIGSRFGAGDSVETLSDDYDYPVPAVMEAIRMWARPRRKEYRQRLEDLMSGRRLMQKPR